MREKQVIEEKELQAFFALANEAYLRLRNDPKAWQEELEERRLWEATLLDGIDTEGIWNPDKRAVETDTSSK